MDTDEKTIEGLIKRFGLEPPESRNYAYPRMEKIAGIPTVIVDPHNEVLPFWYMKGKAPGTLIHIDNHPDTTDFTMSLEYLEEKGIVDMVVYSKYFQTVGSFISAAVFYGLVESVYWINPREDLIVKLGRRHNPDITKLVTQADGRLVWDVNYHPRLPPGLEITFEKMAEEIPNNKPIILDIDLDAFECVEDKDYKLRKCLSLGTYNLLRKSKGVSKRFKVFNRLERLPKPSRITVARSQTPIRYTPKSKVNYLEKRVLSELKRIYE